jgi:hypothetical protein
LKKGSQHTLYNFDSITNKLSIFNAYLITKNIDIFLGCETFLHDSFANNMISYDYNIYTKLILTIVVIETKSFQSISML